MTDWISVMLLQAALILLCVFGLDHAGWSLDVLHAVQTEDSLWFRRQYKCRRLQLQLLLTQNSALCGYVKRYLSVGMGNFRIKIYMGSLMLLSLLCSPKLYLLDFNSILLNFQLSLRQSSMSHYPSEIILMCWFVFKKYFLLLSLLKTLVLLNIFVDTMRFIFLNKK